MEDSVSAPSSAPRTASVVDPELLVAQYGWVRSVAHHLVRDRNRAEDVTQETVLAALAAPPRDAADAQRLRAWLGRVAFNLSKLGARQGLRRRAREERVARREAIPSVIEEVESLATVRELAEAVAALPEPYREAVQMRYFDGLSTAEIAARAGTSELAVRKRLWRARGKLREHLEEPDRRAPAWLAPITGMLRRLRPASPLAAAAAAVATVGTFAFLGRVGLRDEDGSSERVAVAGGALALEASSANESGREALRPGAVESGTGSRQSDQLPTQDADAPEGRDESRGIEVPAVVPQHVAGQVLALDGSPVSGLELFVEGAAGPALARSDRLGGFQVELRDEPLRVVARGAGWTTVVPATLAPELAGGVGREPRVVVAPSAPLAGAVVAAAGPLEGATLEVACTEAAFLALDHALRLDSPVLAATTTAVDGSFAWSELPRAVGLVLRVRAAGHLEREIPTVALAETLWLQLEPDLEMLSGLVRHLDGSFASGARVRLGLGRATTDARGRFLLPLRGIEADSALEVSEDGVESVRKPGFGRYVLAGMRDGVTLTLGEPLEVVEGVLTDPEGGRRANWRVLAYPVTSGSGPQEPSGTAWTDGEGRFRMRLASGPYSVVAIDGSGDSILTEGALDTRHQPWAMRTAPETSTWVEGALLQNGSAVVGARLDVALLLGDAAAPRRVEWSPIETGTGGRWAVRVPARAALHVQADVPGAERHDFTVRAGAEPVELALASTAELRVDAPSATSLRVLDAEGRALAVRGPLGSSEAVVLHEGRSPVLEIGASACWMELTGPAGTHRVPIAVEAGVRGDVRVE